MSRDINKLEQWYKEGTYKNCNTCKHLKRVACKDSYGFLKGICEGEHSPSIMVFDYSPSLEGNLIKFHPNDVHLNPCHVQRELIYRWKEDKV